MKPIICPNCLCDSLLDAACDPGPASSSIRYTRESDVGGDNSTGYGVVAHCRRVLVLVAMGSAGVSPPLKDGGQMYKW